MTLKGHYRNGQIVLDEPVELKEGTPVTVSVVAEPAGTETGPEAEDPECQALWEGLLRLAGTVEGMPADLAENHDHYAHGAPKRELR